MTDGGKDIVFNDPNIDRIRAVATAARDEPLAFLDMKDIFGAVGTSELFRRRFADALRSLQKEGTRATLKRYLEGRLAK